ncbi:KH domain protein [Ignisphaera aggregans DSM 17230]|uniref:KH domain protein n=1 Tax=Ignisphaera aggregans (strain DSM 17230 / JCM 13409 / AQ1.S1) TaxID=583356 RepID=E0SNX7_IGNAA|nr:KH domain protein [Ignisphaera aggregans DSM 17230]
MDNNRSEGASNEDKANRFRRSVVVPGVTKLYLKIPPERLGVLIGKNGEVLKRLSSMTKTKISVDEANGIIVVEPLTPYTDAIDIMKVQDVINAIGYGFSPERAFRLLEEDQILIVIDLKQYVKPTENHLTRIKGRIIGEDGRVRKNIEEMTGVEISVYDDYIAIIGDYESANVAREAIMMLIEGRQHSTVYRYIDRAMKQIKRRRITSMWEKPP